MGTWSISPSSLASIDNNGLVFFREHSSDTSYRITYQDDECGTLTKDVTVFACDTPEPGSCAGSTSSLGSCVSNTATSNAVQIGNWSKNQYCSGSWSFDSSRSVSGTNFINTSTIEFRSNGKIYARISSNNPNPSTRQCKIPTKLGSEKTDYFTVTQCQGGGGGGCSCSSLNLSNTTFHFQHAGTFDGITYTPTDCNVSFSNYPSWVNSITASNGTITASAQQNTSTNMRSGYVDCYVGSERCGQLPVVQDKSPGSQCSTCDDLGIYAVSTNQQDASGKTGAVLATFKTACDPASLSAAKINGDMSITNLGVKNVYTNSWIVSGNVAANTSSSRKAANIAIFIGSSNPCSPTPFNVYQNALTPEPFTMQVIIFNHKSTTIYVNQIRFLGGSTTILGSTGNSYAIPASGNKTMTVTLDASYNGKTFTSFNAMDTEVTHNEYPTNNTGGTLSPNIMISGVVS